MKFAVKVIAFEFMLISWTIIFCGWRKNMGSEISLKNDNLTIRLETTIKAAICELSQYRGFEKTSMADNRSMYPFCPRNTLSLISNQI